MKLERKFNLIIPLYIVFLFTLDFLWAETDQHMPEKPKVNFDVTKINYLTALEKTKLVENGFVISMSKATNYYPSDEAGGIYIKCKESHFPVFVTSDVVLHTSHLLFDWSLRFLEISSLKQDLLNLTDVMLSQSLFYYDQIEDNELKEATLKNAIFFNIAKLLLAEGKLEEVPENIKATIEKEVMLINKHEGFSISPLFGVDEDYSQYIPRGHYSRSPEFEKYFKAMMWYGRMSFRLNTKEVRETLQAILICKALSETKVKGEEALAVWKRIYETTSFFAGSSDDLTAEEYLQLIDKIYEKGNPLSNISDKKKIMQFVKQAGQLRKPKILSTFMTDVSSRNVDWSTQTQAFRFMGQRFAPDSYIFQNLVYDKVKQYSGNDPKPFTAVTANNVCFRGFPRGLDIMNVFGSELAEKILEQEKDTLYNGYKDQLLKLKKEYAFEDKAIWTRDLYWSRIWVLKSILQKPQANVPFFMQSEAWLKKQLNATLGAWSELKHDTICYTKQPYGMSQRAMAGKGGWARYLPAEVVHGYVEPATELYLRVRETITKLRTNLILLNFSSDKALENNFKQFENILLKLESISQKELIGEIPSEEEYQFIENIGRTLQDILKYSHYIDVTENFRSEMDNKMPIIADVFTDVNTNQVLEEAVGSPVEIFVIANVDGKDKVCLGAVYSHYEFKQPMSSRLTDEEWRKMVKENKEPAISPWFNDLVVTPDESSR